MTQRSQSVALFYRTCTIDLTCSVLTSDADGGWWGEGDKIKSRHGLNNVVQERFFDIGVQRMPPPLRNIGILDQGSNNPPYPHHS